MVSSNVKGTKEAMREVRGTWHFFSSLVCTRQTDADAHLSHQSLYDTNLKNSVQAKFVQYNIWKASLLIAIYHYQQRLICSRQNVSQNHLVDDRVELKDIMKL